MKVYFQGSLFLLARTIYWLTMANVILTIWMKSAAMMARTVVQITMELEMVNVSLKTSSRCVTMMEEIVVNLRKSMMGFVTLETWTECVTLMENSMTAPVITRIWQEMVIVILPTTSQIVSLMIMIVYAQILHWLIMSMLIVQVEIRYLLIW